MWVTGRQRERFWRGAQTCESSAAFWFEKKDPANTVPTILADRGATFMRPFLAKVAPRTEVCYRGVKVATVP